MSTSNRMIGMSRRRLTPRRIAARLIFALITGWLAFIFGLAGMYSHELTYPGCPTAINSRTGFQPVSLTMNDGVTLKGWWQAPQNGAVILLMGGSGANADTMLEDADILIRHDYGILTLESRNCAGKPVSFGYHESQDMLSMLAFAQSQPDVTWVGALGFSAGGAAALLATAEESQIRAVVAEGQYSNMLHEITNDRSKPLSFQWQINQAVLLTLWLQTGIWPGQLSPLDDLARIQQPVYLIHGELEADNNQAQLQYQAANLPKELWIVPGVSHGGYLQAFPREYEERLIQFFEEARLN